MDGLRDESEAVNAIMSLSSGVGIKKRVRVVVQEGWQNLASCFAVEHKNDIKHLEPVEQLIMTQMRKAVEWDDVNY